MPEAAPITTAVLPVRPNSPGPASHPFAAPEAAIICRSRHDTAARDRDDKYSAPGKSPVRNGAATGLRDPSPADEDHGRAADDRERDPGKGGGDDPEAAAARREMDRDHGRDARGDGGQRLRRPTRRT